MEQDKEQDTEKMETQQTLLLIYLINYKLLVHELFI
jgi:hypothetical protein